MTPNSPYEQLRAVVELASELQRLRVAALRPPVPQTAADPVAAMVFAAHHLLHTHPIATQAAFQALVAEGRRAAATPEGRGRLEAMAADPRLDAARRLWDASALRLLQEDAGAPVPSSLLDAWMQAAGSPDLDARLAGLLGGLP